MKILYVANIRLPTEKAHGVQIMKTCEALAQAGATVELVVPSRRNDLTEEAFTYYDVSRDFLITVLRVPDLIRFGRMGFIFSQLYFSEMVRWMHSFWSADIVYSRDAGVLLQYLLLGRPLVFEAHTKPTFVARFVARRVYKVIVISRGLKAVFEAAGVSSEKIIVAADAIDLDIFLHPQSRTEARTRLGLPQDTKIAMYVGRLDGWKGTDTLLEASKNFDSVQLAVIGGDSIQVAAAAHIYPQVRFIGYRPYRELADNLAAADMLVLPNTGRDETSARFTSPLKLFAYMASGKPIVASDLPSIREVLSEDEAYFFTPDDPVSLTAQLHAALADMDGASTKAKAALYKVQTYTWGKRAATILDALQSS